MRMPGHCARSPRLGRRSGGIIDMAKRIRLPCSIRGCSTPREAHGWCGKHYMAWNRHGDPEWVPRDDERRFFSHVDRNGPVPEHRPELGRCWLWTARRFSTGYGGFSVRKVHIMAHRWSWQHANGPLPDGLFVLHHCDNPPCVRLSHLFLGTLSDNMQDMIAKGRHPGMGWTHCKRGHEFTPENTWISPTTGKRRCRACDARRAIERKLRRSQ